MRYGLLSSLAVAVVFSGPVMGQGAPKRTSPPSAGPSADIGPLPADPEARWQTLMDRAERAYLEDRSGDLRRAVTDALSLAQMRYPAGDIRIARTLTMQGIGHLVDSQHVEAEAVLRQAIAIIDAARARDSIDGAAALGYLAEARMVQGDYSEAEALLVEAVDTARRRGGPGHMQTARAAMTLGVLLMWRNRPAEAEAILVPARDAARASLGPQHRQTLQLASAVGGLYLKQGRGADAEREFRAALAQADVGLGPEHSTTASLAANLASILIDLGRASEAEPLLRRAIASGTRRHGADHGEVLNDRINLANLVTQRGDYLQGERLARDVLAAIEQRYNADHPQLVDALESVALAAGQQGRIDEALPLQARAVATRRRIEGPDAAATLNSEIRLADYYVTANRLAEAEPLYRRFSEEMTRIFGADNPAALAGAIRLASLLHVAGNYGDMLPQVEALLPRAERIFGAGHPATVHVLHQVGMAHWGLGQKDQAHRAFTDALSRSVGSLGRTNPTTTMVASSLAYLRIEMPEHHRLAVEPAQIVADALRSGRATATATDGLGQQVAEQTRALSAPSLTLVADALWVARGTDGAGGRYILQAFEALQNATAGGADEAVLRTAARQVAAARGADLFALVTRRESAEEAWSVSSAILAAALAEPGTAADALRQQRRDEQQAIDRDLAAIDTELRARFPDYFALIRPEAIGQQAAQAMLGPDEAVVMIVPTDYGTHVMALNADDGTWLRAEITSGQIDWSVRRLLFDLGAPVDVSMAEAARWQEEGGRGYPFSRRTAWTLYTHLIQPLRRILEGKRHVFVITSGSLTSLPLGVLVTEEPTGADGDPAALRATRWLADDHALIRMPTLQSLYLQRRVLAQASGLPQPSGFIGFGDPLLDGAAQARGGGRGAMRGSGTTVGAAFAGAAGPGGGRAALANVAELKRMARLPGTAIELANMRSALGAPASSVRVGAAATESAIRSADLRGARILALATHGLLAGELDGTTEPGLVFTPPSQASASDDGLLTASEIAGLRLDAEWVILSACNTAAGDGSAGAPGLSGLAQAFFFAGARTLLASHWPVRDDVAARITVRTIEIQRDTPTLSRAEAFQLAMREIRNDASHDTVIDTWAHPNAWAAFTLIGDGAQ